MWCNIIRTYINVSHFVGRLTILFFFFFFLSRLRLSPPLPVNKLSNRIAYPAYWLVFRLFSIFQRQDWPWRTSKIFGTRGGRWFTSAQDAGRVINWRPRFEGIKGSSAGSSRGRAAQFAGKSSRTGSNWPTTWLRVEESGNITRRYKSCYENQIILDFR